MSLRLRYILYSLVLHGVIAYFLYDLFKEDPLYFILLESLVLVSIIITLWFFNKMLKPSKIIEAGNIALKSEDFTIKFVEQETIEVNKLIKLYNSMIDQLREEKVKSEESAQFLRKMISVSPVGIIILDYDEKIETANSIGMKYCGISTTDIGRSISKIDSPLLSEIKKMEKNTNKLISLDGLKKFKCQLSSTIHKGFSRKFILIEELTSEILQTEKEAYGKIIKMMAHEVNNSSGSINSILSTVLEYGLDEKVDPEIKNSLEVAKERNVSLSQFIANFAQVLRLPKPDKRTVAINEFILSAYLPWKALAKEKNITINLDLSTPDFKIKFDPNQLDRIFSNALKNAIESIDSDGEIIIHTDKQKNKLSILDNGPGIKEGVKEKLFTPFYSTKTKGQGIGLMLSREIAASHDTGISLKTRKDGWTEFSLEF